MCSSDLVHTKFIPDYGNIIPTKPYTEDLLGLPVINIRYVPLSNTFNALVKRVEIPLSGLRIPAADGKTVRDTVAALRLDAVLGSGFSIIRGKAADLIAAGRVILNGCECMKPDRQLAEGDILAVRGQGRLIPVSYTHLIHCSALLGQSTRTVTLPGGLTVQMCRMPGFVTAYALSLIHILLLRVKELGYVIVAIAERFKRRRTA